VGVEGVGGVVRFFFGGCCCVVGGRLGVGGRGWLLFGESSGGVLLGGVVGLWVGLGVA